MGYRDYRKMIVRLITNHSEWTEHGHGETNYYLTQFPNRQGYFNAYLRRTGKVVSPDCQYRDSPMEDAYQWFLNVPGERHSGEIL